MSFFDGEKTDTDHIRIVDFEHPERNVFNVVNQWTYVEYEEKRPDVIVFVNGMPLVVFELKSPSRETSTRRMPTCSCATTCRSSRPCSRITRSA